MKLINEEGGRLQWTLQDLPKKLRFSNKMDEERLNYQEDGLRVVFETE
jgi:hypothetical protein